MGSNRNPDSGAEQNESAACVCSVFCEKFISAPSAAGSGLRAAEVRRSAGDKFCGPALLLSFLLLFFLVPIPPPNAPNTESGRAQLLPPPSISDTGGPAPPPALLELRVEAAHGWAWGPLV